MILKNIYRKIISLVTGNTYYIDSDGQELTKKTWNNGEIEYTNNQGQIHRLDGPAIVYYDGSECWYKDGLRHRLDGSAYIDSDGSECWYKDGLRHRLDGPAIIYSDGSEDYYLEDIKATKREIDLIWLKKQVGK